MTAVATHSLTKDFGDVRALDSLDLEIPIGSIFGVIGPNGAGKTTLMRLLIDILRPTSGHAVVLGEDPRTAGPELRARIGYLPGELHLEGRLTGRRQVDFWASLGDDPASARDIAHSLAERLELDLGRQSRTLSKGNKQKLGLVQAFMHRPELLILDEPTSGLDPLVQQEVLAIVREARDAGATVFLSSHVLSEVEAVADTAALLRTGRIATVAPMAELRATAVRHLRAVLDGTSVREIRAAFSFRGLAFTLDDLGDGQVAVTGMVEGRADDVVKGLAGFHLVDLVYAEPDLEETVLHLYRGPDAGAETPTTPTTPTSPTSPPATDEEEAR